MPRGPAHGVLTCAHTISSRSEISGWDRLNKAPRRSARGRARRVRSASAAPIIPVAFAAYVVVDYALCIVGGVGGAGDFAGQGAQVSPAWCIGVPPSSVATASTRSIGAGAAVSRARTRRSADQVWSANMGRLHHAQEVACGVGGAEQRAGEQRAFMFAGQGVGRGHYFPKERIRESAIRRHPVLGWAFLGVRSPGSGL